MLLVFRWPRYLFATRRANARENSMIRASFFGGLLIAAMGFSSAWAQGNGKGQGHGKVTGQQVQTSGQFTLSATITTAERQTIIGYFQQHQASYVGMKPVPPGIAKKIARGGTMPPGIAKRYFPGELIALLPPRPGEQWLIVGTDVLLVQAATSLILDILPRVF
jgi:hypothetical protein